MSCLRPLAPTHVDRGVRFVPSVRRSIPRSSRVSARRARAGGPPPDATSRAFVLSAIGVSGPRDTRPRERGPGARRRRRHVEPRRAFRRRESRAVGRGRHARRLHVAGVHVHERGARRGWPPTHRPRAVQARHAVPHPRAHGVARRGRPVGPRRRAPGRALRRALRAAGGHRHSGLLRGRS